MRSFLIVATTIWRYRAFVSTALLLRRLQVARPSQASRFEDSVQCVCLCMYVCMYVCLRVKTVRWVGDGVGFSVGDRVGTLWFICVVLLW